MVKFGSLKLRKLELLHSIDSLDLIRESRALTSIELVKESDALSDLNSLLHQEEIYWKQRSRIKWLKEGDCNSKFFHAFANGRRNKNFIPRTLDNGVLVEGSINLGITFATHFKKNLELVEISDSVSLGLPF